MPDKLLFPDEKIIVTKYFDIHQDQEIPIPGFFIIASKRKINSITDFTEQESKEFINLLIKVRKAMRDILKINEVYLFQNEDSDHGFHLWIFPRLVWMDKFGRKIQSVRPIINYAKENLTDKENIDKVKEYVKQMKEFISR